MILDVFPHQEATLERSIELVVPVYLGQCMLVQHLPLARAEAGVAMEQLDEVLVPREDAEDDIKAVQNIALHLRGDVTFIPDHFPDVDVQRNTHFLFTRLRAHPPQGTWKVLNILNFLPTKFSSELNCIENEILRFFWHKYL